MDDHRWAFYVWERYRHGSPAKDRAAIVHLDGHFDGVCDIQTREDRNELRALADLDTVHAKVSESDGIGFDSFIAPAILRGWVREVHFYVTQEDTDPGIDSDVLNEGNCVQFIHASLNDLANRTIERPLYFDLCLDLYCDGKKQWEATRWVDEKVLDSLTQIAHLVAAADIVTVSLSFGYSGSEDQTRHLARTVVPVLQEMMSNQ